MSFDPATFAWNFCPICGARLEVRDDGFGDRPHCGACRRFYYSNPVPAVCCFVTQGEKLLHVRRAVEPHKGEWSLPGGYVELGETTEQAALREFEEETGLRGHGLRLIGASTRPSRISGAVIVLGYIIERWDGVSCPGSDVTELDFFSKGERPALAFDVHRELLGIFDSLTMSSR
jgi:ADP-ribose pyrophosphatase YjhB (NUDIX family)